MVGTNEKNLETIVDRVDLKPDHYHNSMKVSRKNDEELHVQITNKLVNLDNRQSFIKQTCNFTFTKYDFAVTNSNASIIKSGGYGKIYLVKKFCSSQYISNDNCDIEHKFIIKSAKYSAKADGSHNDLEVMILSKLKQANPDLCAYLNHVYIDTNKNYSSNIFDGQLLTLMNYMEYDLQEILFCFDTLII